MKLYRIFLIGLLLCITGSSAMAWNCSDPLASRVDVGSTKPTGTAGDGDGQWYKGTDAANPNDYYVCQVPKTPPTTPVTSSQSQQQNQAQNQTQSATGGNATAKGGTAISASNATGGSVTGSGNSSNTNKNQNTNTNTANGGAGGTATSTAANNSSGNTSNYSSDSSYTEVRQNPGAYAPIAAFTTSSCAKGFSGGAGTPSVAATLGFVLTDKGCDSRQTAVIFHAIGNDFAAAKTLCATDASKRAHLTLDECERVIVPVPVSTVPIPVTPPTPTIIVVPVPTPVAAVAPPTPVVIPALNQISTLRDIGSCTMTNLHLTNVCKRMLDDASLRLENLPNARLVLTGPVEATQAAAFLRNRVNRSRIELRLADEQDYTLNIQLFEVN